jgi:hypothetical protein
MEKTISSAFASLLEAIIEERTDNVREVLKKNPSLANSSISAKQQLEEALTHWFYKGDTPLHFAAAGHRPELVQILLKAGANPNATANRRRSGPLHYAADGYINSDSWNPLRQARTIQALLDGGAEITAQDANGATPLHRAVRTRCVAAVKTLLEAGADPRIANKSGSTPFHLAVQNTGRGGSGAEIAKAAQRAIIEAFLKRGVSTGLRDGKGKTVLDAARSEWVRALLQACI